MRVPFLTASLSRGFGRAVAACGLFACLAFAGCSKQGQGERCDQNNGNLDCEGDLVCKGEAQLSLQGQTRGVGLCCPAGSDQNTVEACRATATLPPEPDAGPVQETPTPVEPTPDAGAQPDAAAPAP
jgi:hypothetical protein